MVRTWVCRLVVIPGRLLFHCLQAMKRMDRNMVRGPLYKQFDLEQKNARQAEARLSLSLQRLEVICLYHVKSLAREQRQLQKELHRLQQDIIKKRVSSYGENGIQKRPRAVVTVSPQTGWRHLVLEPKIRVPSTNMTQEVKTKIQGPSLHGPALKDALRSQEQLQSQLDRTSCCEEENSQAQKGASANPLKGTDPNKEVSVPCRGQEVSTKTEDSPTSSPAGKTGSASADETRSKNAGLKPPGDARDQNPPSSVECAGSFKGNCTKPTFLELFAKAKNAHYLRHRVPPESERLLSIGEIFGHGDSSLPRAGKRL
ncbi:coiled-coil domain-containing protein 190 isoform X2 [Peromyscus californicus insignis]|uniref:coiled-coil domain-containing protein 190 isoform X2 n=1 Tax=Peromyscus californicus insignis TaxID=564181 RepID=UPI0022A759A7|nr:coiled-coil domain-containing protein 190 isoform X2 [Peromyscus californicus insignis]